MNKHSEQNPCGICGGHRSIPKGRGERCYGFTSQDDKGYTWVCCTRPEYAGNIRQNSNTSGYHHAMYSGCHCGTGHDSQTGSAMAVDLSKSEGPVSNNDFAQLIFAKAHAINHSPVEKYLKARGLELPFTAPSVLRYDEIDHKPSGLKLPAMIARVHKYSGNGTTPQPVAIHRTYLDPSGEKKADVEPNKMMLGSVAGGAVMFDLGVPRHGPLIIAEGIETALSLSESTGHAAWAALSASGIASVFIPDDKYSNVLIAADNDDDGTGRRAAERLRERLHDMTNIFARIIDAPEGMDFNDLLQEATYD